MGIAWTIPGWVLGLSGSNLHDPNWDVINRPLLIARALGPEPVSPFVAPPGLSDVETAKFFHAVHKAANEAERLRPPHEMDITGDYKATPGFARLVEWAGNAAKNWIANEYPWARVGTLRGVANMDVINDAKKYRKYFKQAAQEMLATGKLEFYQQRVPTDVFLQFSEIFNKALIRPDRLTDPEIGVLLGAGFDPWGVAERAAEQEKIIQAMLPPLPAAQPPPPPPKGNANQPRGAAPAPAQPASADALLAALLGGAGGAPGFSSAPPPPSAPVASPVPGVGGGFDPRTFGRQLIRDQRLMAAGALNPATAAAMYNRVPAAPVLPQNAVFGALSPFF